MERKRFTKLVGIKEETFINFIKEKRIFFQEAKLIPLLKTGDEMALTSIFLSSLRLVKEFRYSIFDDLNIHKRGKFYYFTEVNFKEFSNLFFDGLIILVKGNKIFDAIAFEVKKENNKIEDAKIKEYIELAIKLKIPKFVTISNQFVSEPRLVPYVIKKSKKIDLFHFSWSYILTKARILLFEKHINIEDTDQVEIMREVLHYFENKKSGIKGYTMMNSSWKKLTEYFLTNKKINDDDINLKNAILSWYQEEKDMALVLSKELGLMVKSKFRNNDSILADIKSILKNKSVVTTLKVKDSVSPLLIKASFIKRNVSMEVEIKPPEYETNIGKINWLSSQLKTKKNKALSLHKYVYLTAIIKYSKAEERKSLLELHELKKIPKSDEIKLFKLSMVKDFGKNFISSKGFVKVIEKMLLDFYGNYVQNLSNWTKPAPKIEKE